ncbi:MAG: hypothetical protein IT354_13445 [Gemmatimonadaceae bacterium]|nr:hypothetical protein [Gemmatimonadaceae bacterium]
MPTDRDTATADALRTRAANARTNAPAPLSGRAAPIEQGERLATASRGENDELRFSWSEYNGRHFFSARLWQKGSDGAWWPVKDKGIAIRRHELPALAEAVAAALDRAEAPNGSQDGGR